MRWLKVLGLAAFAGVAATGVVVVRDQRRRQAYTPAELEVVRLVGEGLRNDAIARRLFIAPSTVKVHLTHIFAKLGLTTRAELAAQAAAHDLTAR